ncbi:myelin basic protein isoform X1 [Gorilla gorilla gorilla]|nr:myelin basic protein isoform X1 [Gorilla gorilla gorilla]
MGNHAGKRELNAEKASTNSETNRGESEKKRNLGELSRTTSEDNEVFGEADANQNNGTSSQDTAVTDSKRTADPKNAWQDAHPADPGSRPHLIRLFSRDAPGREDNTFKDRPSESDELQTIQEDSAATSESLDVMASQKRPSQRHGSKYLATASTMDHARHGFLPRHRDTGILDSIGRFFGGDRGAPKRGSGKDSHHPARTAHYGSLPQKSHGRTQDENPVVHFFKNIVTPRTPPPSQGKGRGLSLSRFSWVGDERTSIGFLFRPSPHSPATFVFCSVSVASWPPFLSSRDLSAHSWDRAALSSTGEMKRGLPFRKVWSLASVPGTQPCKARSSSPKGFPGDVTGLPPREGATPRPRKCLTSSNTTSARSPRNPHVEVGLAGPSQ